MKKAATKTEERRGFSQEETIPAFSDRTPSVEFARDICGSLTVWSRLIGPFVHAYLSVYGDRKVVMSFLEPLGTQIESHGLETLSEIFDGDAPFSPRGCIAQAWTVAEVLRAWRAAPGSSDV
jgi:hypothetical protein